MGQHETKNYIKEGGDETVIGGTLTISAAGTLAIVNGATVTGLTGQTTFASAAEIETGTESAKVIAPDTLKAALAALPNKILMGVLSSENDVSGITVSAANSKALAVHADSGGAALLAGNVRAGLARMLVGTAITDGRNTSISGWEALLKMIVSVNVGGNRAGILAHLESAGTLTLTGSINTVLGAIMAFVDLAAGATVAAGTVLSAFGVNPANFGTVAGRTAIIHVTNPVAGAWGSLFDLSGDQGLAAAAAGAVNDKHGVIYASGVKYTFPLYRAA
jgi:hypothetical protein